jgi:lipoprotein-releasing system ATP-binding protein
MAIELTDIRKSFGNPPFEVLKGISLKIENGEFVSFVGKSGCGKSTLLYIMSTLDQPTSGTVMIDGMNVHTLPEKELHQFRNLKMGFVFQFHHLLPELSALENVLMPAIKAKQGETKKEMAQSLLTDFGLASKFHNHPGQLSGGEQQRVAIARALIMEPEYLFADEPTGNLDSVNGNIVMNLLAKINKARNMTVIYVTHDEDFANRAARQVQMADGRLIN